MIAALTDAGAVNDDNKHKRRQLFKPPDDGYITGNISVKTLCIIPWKKYGTLTLTRSQSKQAVVFVSHLFPEDLMYLHVCTP